MNYLWSHYISIFLMEFANVGVFICDEKEDMLRLAYKSFRNLSTGEPVPVNEIENLLEQDIPIEVAPYSDIVFDNDNYYTRIENTEELENLLMDGFHFHDSDIFTISTDSPDELEIFYISNSIANLLNGMIAFSLEKANKLVHFAQQLKEQERINTTGDIKLSLVLWKFSWS